MKKAILLGLLVISTSFVNAQVLISLLLGDKLNSPDVEFGLDGGVNFANISNLESGKSIPLFNIGFYFDIRLKGPWLLHTGVLVKSNQGARKIDPYSLGNDSLDVLFADGYVSRKVGVFSVPILIKYRFAEIFHVEAGPMLELRSKSYDIFTNDIKQKKDLTYKLNVSDNYRRIDAGIMVGAGFKLSKQLKSLQTGVRYYYGLVDMLKDNPGKAQNFSSLYLYLDIPIGAGKAAEKGKETK